MKTIAIESLSRRANRPFIRDIFFVYAAKASSISFISFSDDTMMEEKQNAEDGCGTGGGGGGGEMIVFEGKQGSSAEEQQQMMGYPAPLFTHEELCGNPGIFIEALRRFHSLMGTKFMIPVIGGKDLNLHQLYVEVTQRGGLEKVIVEKRWREVIVIFNFPPTTTSASFVLRKYYLSLLHHFEQVYFFGARGALVPPAAALQTRSPMCKLMDVDREESGPSIGKKRAFPSGHLPVQELPLNAKECGGLGSLLRNAAVCGTPASAACPLSASDGVGVAASSSIHSDGSMPSATGGAYNFTVSGTIDGKFDHGYFVTVKIGSQLLHGVLYHIQQHQLGSPPSACNTHQPPVPSSTNPAYKAPAASSSDAATMEKLILPCVPARRSGGRRRRLKSCDPARPKPNRSAYNFFFAEKHSELKVQYPHMEREYSKKIGESWNKLTEEERLVFEGYARRDKERYKKELQVYKERLKFTEPKGCSCADEMARKEVARREMMDCREKMIAVATSSEKAASVEMAKQEVSKRLEVVAQELGKEVAVDSVVVNTEALLKVEN
ncbi:hypothetical protein HPP92_003491 [Vanilla planifolia]|uniref:High mobility group B protein 9 n=1 Tax=Vanilla planifolia TaxID=51239 RepID=A0A835RUI5_VANPL|nr:hypothetical protein HPP92_003491 [Vanilla planifolia]